MSVKLGGEESILFRGTKELGKKKVCINCGSSYPGYHSGKKYCSIQCFLKARVGSYHHSEETKELIRLGNLGKVRSPESIEKWKRSWMKKKHLSWCKGLSAETNEILRRREEKRMQNRVYIRGKENHSYGRTHTFEEKLRMREIRSMKILRGETSNGNKNGWYFSTKLNRDIRYLSSWEEKAFRLLDKSPKVTSFNPSPFRVPYLFKGEQRFYIPDIEVKADSKTIVVELKPDFYKDYPINQAKFEAARQFCNSLKFDFKVLNINEFERAFS